MKLFPTEFMSLLSFTSIHSHFVQVSSSSPRGAQVPPHRCIVSGAFDFNFLWHRLSLFRRVDILVHAVVIRLLSLCSTTTQPFAFDWASKMRLSCRKHRSFTSFLKRKGELGPERVSSVLHLMQKSQPSMLSITHSPSSTANRTRMGIPSLVNSYAELS